MQLSHHNEASAMAGKPTILIDGLNDVHSLCRRSVRASVKALYMAAGDSMSSAEEKAKRLNEQAAALRECQ